MKFIEKLFIYVASIAVIAASAFTLYDNQGKIKTLIHGDTTAEKEYANTGTDAEWAHKLMQGGYILHFRHAERDKWIDVHMYDSLESDLHENGENGTRFAEHDYFAKAVCLNERGKVQAKAIGEHLNHIALPIGAVASSPSCRSRQTAELSFGGYDTLHRILVHKGPYSENENERARKLTELYLNLPMEEGKNTIVSAHNGVVSDKMFANVDKADLSIEEGGFYVISKKDGKLHLEHEFHFFKKFSKHFYKR